MADVQVKNSSDMYCYESNVIIIVILSLLTDGLCVKRLTCDWFCLLKQENFFYLNIQIYWFKILYFN